MRMSCNGCRVLRKGCSPDCRLRPCLEWLKSAESQANATFFLAKFYGRAGLINLINAGPPHLRPDIFKSLLYEACGRIIDPINGSAGLMYSGDWPRCQAAVAAVLEGGQIMKQVSKDSAASLHRGLKRFSSSLVDSVAAESSEVKFTITGWGCGEDHDSFSVGTVLDGEPVPQLSEVGLELTLGLNPVLQTYLSSMIKISD